MRHLTPSDRGGREHATLTVLSTGPLATVQDFGRPGRAHLGVPRSGAADLPALAQANRLVGNPEGAAAIEVTLGGWSARATGRMLLAVTGPAVRVTIDGVEAGSHSAIGVRDGAVVRVDAPVRGCRNYVAVRGGFDVLAELGSRSTDTLSGLGPDPLRVGDVLAIGSDENEWPASGFAPVGSIPEIVSLVAATGPRDDRVVDVTVLGDGRWTVSPASNRIGVRLDRVADDPPVRHRDDVPEMRSEGVPLGGVQIPPSGQPVIFLADHPVTGGYPVVAVLTAESVSRAAQLTAGDEVRIVLR
ncbi:biotin-dependent carboxyltransferase family protein [Gordonia neofelifaecis]|uniref:Urea amidolyase related protein n=1 Tax=Gordonia neofelifaecis NRRL B-59395 TaxID=644548 RepID=F1YLV6_9ACTN|nr:biotin-dependent carboxyltransferase family protein [Gordonia neofelifaecis]EGD54207.1 urea amidolyase related protein [Gordonia neofelifaecis NRRL B-59395]